MKNKFVIELESLACDIESLIKENEHLDDFPTDFSIMEKYDLILEKILKTRKKLEKNIRLYIDELAYAKYLISYIEETLHFNKSQYARYKKLNKLKII